MITSLTRIVLSRPKKALALVVIVLALLGLAVVALVTLLGRIVGPMNAVTALPAQYSAMSAALDRIYSTIGDTKPDNEQPSRRRDNTSQLDVTSSRTNAIELSNVHYSYKGVGGSKAQAVEGVTLTVPAGKSVTIAGESGSGKTTLALLISGVMEPSTGEVRVHAGMTLGMMPSFLRYSAEASDITFP